MYQSLCSFSELYYAYCRARKLRRQKRCVVRFEQSLEHNLGYLLHALSTKTYYHGMYREFIVCDSKKRLIRAAPFSDRIVHHVVCAHIEPLFEKRFIYDSYVCRKQKGTHRAIRRLKKFMYGVSRGYTRRAYFLKLDISKYFQSIDHEILYVLLTRVIEDVDIRNLLRLIIDSSYDSNRGGRKKGIPIGNLTSQLFANIYLNELDHYAKEHLYCRYYIRYMDDIVICSEDKHQLHDIRDALQTFLTERLLLTIHPHKVFISPITTGIPFLGYILFPHYIRLRTSTIKRCKRRIKKYVIQLQKNKITTQKIQTSRASWYGYAKHAHAWHISKKIWSHKTLISLEKNDVKRV